jgi:hypothetical protein
MLEDAERGETVVIDSGDRQVREDYQSRAAARIEDREWLFRSTGVDHIPISTDAPYADRLVQFFTKRKKRIR